MGIKQSDIDSFENLALEILEHTHEFPSSGLRARQMQHQSTSDQPTRSLAGGAQHNSKDPPTKMQMIAIYVLRSRKNPIHQG